MEVQQSLKYELVAHLPFENIKMQDEEAWKVSYVIIGSGLKLIGDMSTEVKNSEVVLIPPGMPHCWYYDGLVTDEEGNVQDACVIFTDATLSHCLNVFPEMERYIERLRSLKMAIKFGPEQSEKIAAVIRSMKTMSNARRIAALLRLILLVAEDQVADVVGKIEELDKNERLRRQVDTYITCNVHRDFKLDDIAAHMDMKPSSFCVFFKKLTGKTFVTYLNEYRMERICKQLRETDAPVSEICYDNGFKNIPYFNRTFKRMMGVNPSEYRAEMNGTIETEG